jgi:ubiquinone/menaquinone biosynthesis C-methylase UbiE
VSMRVKLSPIEGYRLWAETWESDPSAIVALESRWLSRWFADLRGKVVVDLSCGVGRWLAHAKSLGAIVFGTDLCLEMLDKAAKKPGLAGRLALADTRHLPLADGCADVVLCALSLGHMAPVESAMSELVRVVAPGGSLIVSDFHPDAAQRGWKRTFRNNGQLYEVETNSYRKEQLIRCALRGGLVLQGLREACFDDPEREIFRRAGKDDLFDRVRGLPAVLLARWTRP